jgi:hypothetical protein
LNFHISDFHICDFRSARRQTSVACPSLVTNWGILQQGRDHKFTTSGAKIKAIDGGDPPLSRLQMVAHQYENIALWLHPKSSDGLGL